MKKEFCALVLSLSAIATTICLTKDAPPVALPVGEPHPGISISQKGVCMVPYFRMEPFLSDSNPLGLSDAQKENIDRILDFYQSVTRPYLRRIGAGREAILALVRQGEFDNQAARAIASGLAEDMTELMVDYEHLEAMIVAELEGVQRRLAGEILKEVDELLGASDVGHGEELARMDARISAALSLSSSQKRRLERIIGAERNALRPLLCTCAKFNAEGEGEVFRGYFHEQEARVGARARAVVLGELLVSTGRCMARLYAMLNDEQKKKFGRLDDEVESYVKSCILLLPPHPPAATIAPSSPALTRM